jgi:hypothetical protein
MIDSSKVGVKSPVTGIDSAVAEGAGFGVATKVAFGVGDGFRVGDRVGVGRAVGVVPKEFLGVAVGLITGVGLGLKVGDGLGEGVLPDGVATNAGNPPACTTKSLVSVLVTPLVSTQDIVMVWGPSERGAGGL